jgi:uncharacterized protein
MHEVGDTKLLVIQPTSFCNLNCKYCYVPDRRNSAQMNVEVLEKAIKCLFRDKTQGEVDILYHAGEPMSVGINFYEEALRIITENKPPELIVTNVIQTNGTLINDNWCQFFIKNNFKVGVSIDGPEFLHDLNRINWSNSGSFNKALNGFKLLKKYGINSGVLTVITSKHLENPDELIKFYLENEITDVGFNIEEIENNNQISSLGDIIDLKKDKYSNFMSRVFDLVLENGNLIKIREIADIIQMLYSKQTDHNYNTNPLESRDLAIVTIQRNGDISTYCPEFAGSKSQEYNNFIIGNVLEIDKLSDVKNNLNYQKIKKHYDQRKKLCKSQCKYYSVCGSAFLSNSYFESGSLLATENIACILQKQELSEVILAKLKKTTLANVKSAVA